MATNFIKGIGTDIIEVKRLEKAIGRLGEKFLNRIFTPREQAYCKRYKESSRHFAGRFAAKEATAKALGTGLNKEANWLDIEILNDPQGKPYLNLSERLRAWLGPHPIHLSLSHCHEYATAVVIIEQ